MDQEDNKNNEKETEIGMERLVEWKKQLPYNIKRYIMIIGMLILIFLVVFLGVAYGGTKVCNDLDGLLDSEFKCHPNYYFNISQQNFDSVGQPFSIPAISELT